jgi:hypothetical protein
MWAVGCQLSAISQKTQVWLKANSCRLSAFLSVMSLLPNIGRAALLASNWRRFLPAICVKLAEL